MLSKEEIEKAKEDLIFFNEGDYITKEMSKSAQIIEKYIKQLEKDKEDAYWKGYIQKQNECMEICKMCKYREKARELEQDKQKLLEKLEELHKDMLKNGSMYYAKKVKEIMEKMQKNY